MQELMKENWHFIEEMTDKLKALNPKPCEIILFGSYATGNPTEHSDIDVVVVLDSDYIVKTHDEKMDRNRPVTMALIEIIYKIPIDVFVYSKAEVNCMREKGSSFIKEVYRTGKVLYGK